MVTLITDHRKTATAIMTPKYSTCSGTLEVAPTSQDDSYKDFLHNAPYPLPCIVTLNAKEYVSMSNWMYMQNDCC